MNELKKVNYRTVGVKKRNAIVNYTTPKVFNKMMGELDDEYSELSNAKKVNFARDTVLAIYFCMIKIMKILLYHH